MFCFLFIYHCGMAEKLSLKLPQVDTEQPVKQNWMLGYQSVRLDYCLSFTESVLLKKPTQWSRDKPVYHTSPKYRLIFPKTTTEIILSLCMDKIHIK